MDDYTLLRKYADDNDERAFGKLVDRYYDLVYRTAYAKTQNRQIAEDVATAVFLLLSTRARSIGSKTIIAGWLFKAAQLTALNAVRIESRRSLREREAAKMMEQAASRDKSADIETLGIMSDGLMKMSEQDRNAVLLRYALGFSIDETAQALNVGAEAARKRASRGIDRLRRYCQSHGAFLTTGVLLAALGEKSAHAAPESIIIAKICNASSLLHTSSSIQNLYKGTVKIMTLSKVTGIAAAALSATILFGGGYTIIRANEPVVSNIATKGTTKMETPNIVLENPKTPKELVETFLGLLAAGNTDKAYHLISGLSDSSSDSTPKNLDEQIRLYLNQLSGVKIVSIGEPMDADYTWRKRVPYDLEIKSMTVQTGKGPVTLKNLVLRGSLWVRNDNPTHTWGADGIPDAIINTPSTSAKAKKKSDMTDEERKQIAQSPKSAKETATIFFNLLATEQADEAYSLMSGAAFEKLPKLLEDDLKLQFQRLSGLKVDNIGEPELAKDGSNRWIVPYEVEMKETTYRTLKGPVTVKWVIQKGDIGVAYSKKYKAWEVNSGVPG